MKIFLCFISFFAVLAVIQCQYDRYDDFLKQMNGLNMTSMQTSAIEKIKSALNCPDVDYELEDALRKTMKCLSKVDESDNTACYIVRNDLPQCLNPLIKVIKQCIPDKSKDIPEFFVKAIVRVVNYLCKIDGEHIFELENSCIFKYSPSRNMCLRKVEQRVRLYQRSGIGAQELCEVVTAMRPCLKSHLLMSCGSPITRESVIGTLDAFLSECKTVQKDNTNEIDELPKAQFKGIEDFSK